MQRLTENDLQPLVQQLRYHEAKWREIGTHLGFRQGELDVIQANPLLLSGAPKSWFSAMLIEWLQWAPRDSRGSTNFATLEDLKEALLRCIKDWDSYFAGHFCVMFEQSYLPKRMYG